jgi:hypothetical protein
MIFLMSALLRVSLMLVLNRSLFNREYILINVLKASASIISMYNVHVIFLSKIIPIYYMLFTNGMFRPFSVRWRSTTARKVNPLSFVFIYFNIPALTPGPHWAETALEFSDNKTLLSICRVHKFHCQTGLGEHQLFGGHHLYMCCTR